MIIKKLTICCLRSSTLPCSPFSPLVPLGPSRPFSPMAPVFPLSPLSLVAPGGPCSPSCPGGDLLARCVHVDRVFLVPLEYQPVAPLGPQFPSIPCGPRRPCRTGGITENTLFLFHRQKPKSRSCQARNFTFNGLGRRGSAEIEWSISNLERASILECMEFNNFDGGDNKQASSDTYTFV